MQAERRARRDALLRTIGRRPVVMGILNVTPDSFSDGGCHLAAVSAVAHARAMLAEGCDVVDVGGESTRPGAGPVTEADEWARIEPVLAGLATLEIAISIDTYKAGIAARALGCGAVMVNDVWGLQRDPEMAGVIAAGEAIAVIMHNRTEKDETIDIVSDIRRFFDQSLMLAQTAGIAEERIILDPGIGFAKTTRQNRDVLAHLSELRDYGRPILIGASRKAFLGSLLPSHAEATLAGTIAVALAAAEAGAALFRVHDVAAHVAALGVFHTIRGDR